MALRTVPRPLLDSADFLDIASFTYPIVETFHSIQGKAFGAAPQLFLFASPVVMWVAPGATPKFPGIRNVIPKFPLVN